MKLHPILFSAQMVRALLDGSKTQTRRVLKQAIGPSLSVGMSDDQPGVAELSWLYGDGPGHEVHEATKRVPCPYGQPGDHLWVRETWAYGIHALSSKDHEREGPWVYAADGEVALQGRLCDRWRPSIHMFQSASRITLEITGVRVERLQDISEADAIAEGASSSALEKIQAGQDRWARRAYRTLWEQINGTDSWDLNPWVWVIEFKRTTGEPK